MISCSHAELIIVKTEYVCEIEKIIYKYKTIYEILK